MFLVKNEPHSGETGRRKCSG